MQGDVFAVDPQIKVETINSLRNQGYMAFDVSQYCEWLKKSELDQLALIVTVSEVPGEKATQLAKTLVQRDSNLNINSIMFYTLPAAPSEENPSSKRYRIQATYSTVEAAVEACKWLWNKNFNLGEHCQRAWRRTA